MEQILKYAPEGYEIVKPIWDQFRKAYQDKKGLLLIGAVGTGKTTAMEIYWRMGFISKPVSCRKIVREALQDVSTLERYASTTTGQNVQQRALKGLCLDDLGLEPECKIYGNAFDVVSEVVFDRYEKKLLTFATTNLDIDGLTLRYGERITDRLKEMMNIFVLTGKSRRK